MYPFNLISKNEINNNIYTTHSNETDSNDINLHHQTELHTMKDKKIIDMLLEAMIDEKQDAKYYSELMLMTKSEDDKETLKNISLQEKKHYAILSEIYKELTGTTIDVNYTHKHVNSVLEKNYDKSFYDEIKGFEFYRKLYFLFADRKTRNMIYEIMTDEQNHASKLNHLLIMHR